MLSHFPTPYPDEILYSMFSRYAKRTSYNSPRYVSLDLFGKTSIKPNLYVPMYLNFLSSQLKIYPYFTLENIINNHTLFAFYKSFITKDRAEEEMIIMKEGSPKSKIRPRYISDGKVLSDCKHKYCPSCYREDIKKYGEAYLHRIHQIPGNLICGVHRIDLKMIDWEEKKNEYLNINDIQLELNFTDKYNNKEFLDLIKDIKKVLCDQLLSTYSLEMINLKYDKKIEEEKYLYCGEKQKIKKRALAQDFNKSFTQEFLEEIESEANTKKGNNWINKIDVIPSYYNRVHPIRHILFIRFLFGSIENFINY